jgi:hypothetical protein
VSSAIAIIVAVNIFTGYLICSWLIFHFAEGRFAGTPALRDPPFL